VTPVSRAGSQVNMGPSIARATGGGALAGAGRGRYGLPAPCRTGGRPSGNFTSASLART
jgi:hypothetical protein